MAGHHDRQRIASRGGARGARRSGRAGARGELGVADRLAEGHLARSPATRAAGRACRCGATGQVEATGACPRSSPRAACAHSRSGVASGSSRHSGAIGGAWRAALEVKAGERRRPRRWRRACRAGVLNRAIADHGVVSSAFQRFPQVQHGVGAPGPPGLGALQRAPAVRLAHRLQHRDVGVRKGVGPARARAWRCTARSTGRCRAGARARRASPRPARRARAQRRRRRPRARARRWRGRARR